MEDEFLLRRFASEVEKLNKDSVALPAIDRWTRKYHMQGLVDPDDRKNTQRWSFDGFHANWGDFSEQNAIDCVDFFIRIMREAQRFATAMPTVGGDIHIALVSKSGYKSISKEEYTLDTHR